MKKRKAKEFPRMDSAPLVHVMPDVNVFMDVLREGQGKLPSEFPSPIAPGKKRATAVLGSFFGATKMALWTTDHILEEIQIVVAHYLPEASPIVLEYIEIIKEVAELSGGGVIENAPRRMHASKDFEDCLMIDGALELKRKFERGEIKSSAPAGTLPVICTTNDKRLIEELRGEGFSEVPVISLERFSLVAAGIKRAEKKGIEQRAAKARASKPKVVREDRQEGVF